MHHLAATPDSFFFLVLCVVVITRVYLHSASVLSHALKKDLILRPSIKGARIHHYVYGIVVLLIGLASKQLLAIIIGLGLILDEVWFVAGLGGDDRKYRSFSSLIGAVVSLSILFLFRVQIFNAISMLIS